MKKDGEKAEERRRDAGVRERQERREGVGEEKDERMRLRRIK